MAFVICLVCSIAFIWSLISDGFSKLSPPSEMPPQHVLGLIIKIVLGINPGQQIGTILFKIIEKSRYHLFHVSRFHRVKGSASETEKQYRLLTQRIRLVFILIENLRQLLSSFKSFPCAGIEIRAETAKTAISLYWASSIRRRPDTFLMALYCAALPTLDTESPVLIAGLIPE